MTTRLLSLLIWASAAACGTFWGLAVMARPSAVPEGVRQVAAKVALAGELEHVLGSSAAPMQEQDEGAAAPTDARFQLLGVVSPPGPAAQRGGWALISIDNQPARPWRTGALVGGEMVLQSVSKRGAVLMPQGGGEAITLALPEPGQAPAAAAAPQRLPGHLGAGMPRPSMSGAPGAPQVGAPANPPNQGGDDEEE